MTIITELLCEYRQNPLGIDVTAPRFSWKIQSQRSGARQIAYRIRAASELEGLSDGKVDVWDSGKVSSDQSVHVVYAGPPLISRQRVYWNVTVWDENGYTSQSNPAWFEIGLLHRNEWRAAWVGAAMRGGPQSTIPAPYLRKSFTLPSSVKSARLYITALGLFECSINGQCIAGDVLVPGWTDYHRRIQYMTYDISSLLRSGDNVIGVTLGDGWACGHVGWAHRQQYVDRPRLFAQLEISLENGNTITIPTDSTWKYSFGPIMSNDLLMGEDYDARLEMLGWDRPGFDDTDWYGVEVFDDLGAALVATNGPTVRRIQELPPVSDPVDKSTLNGTRHIFDLGQNMVGRVRFKGTAPEGTTITLRFAEALNPDGSLYTANLRSARATDYYTFGRQAEVVWEPKFTFHGFRYVELQDYPGEVTRDTITGIVLHSEMNPTGTFECSDPLINQLQHNIVWGQKGNFVDVPTDCPQRDERLGWTGDIQVFVRTSAFNMDVAGFMTKWVQDVADAQNKQGMVPPVVPKLHTSFLEDGGPAWADAAIICPWTIYLCYGDTRILETGYATMSKFMDFLIQSSPGLIRCAPEYEGWHGFGDWLSINAQTPRDLIGTAFFAYDAKLMAQIATILGNSGDAEKYGQLFNKIKAAFAECFLFGSRVTATSVMPSDAWKRQEETERLSHGTLQKVDYEPTPSDVFNTNLFTPTQTAYVLGLHFDLLPRNMRSLAVRELVADIERRGMHLSTGFVGSPYLPHVLSRAGRSDIAFSLLRQTSWPSWLYSVTQGATTIWERWDGWTPERGFQTPEMNSLNHYAYGAIGDWLYNTVAGIEPDPAQPGYKHIFLSPQPGGELTSAAGRLKTLYGEVASEWEIVQGVFSWRVVVPPNSSATAYLPVGDKQPITLDDNPVSGLVHELQSGEHRFVVG